MKKKEKKIIKNGDRITKVIVMGDPLANAETARWIKSCARYRKQLDELEKKERETANDNKMLNERIEDLENCIQELKTEINIRIREQNRFDMLDL